MTVWELAACIDGYNAAHGGEQEPEPMTGQEFDALVEEHRELIR